MINNSLPVLMDQVVINRVGQHKHLGITLTCNLTWDSHVANVVKQANVLCGVKPLDRRTLDLLYKINIRSRIDYCLQVYGPALKIQQTERLEKIHYSAARLVTETKKVHK